MATKSIKKQVRKTSPAEIASVRACADDLCKHLAAGKTLSDFCRQPGRPSNQRIYDALAMDAELMGKVARAREVGHDAIAEDTLRIIDNPPERVDTPFGPRIDSAAVQWHKNRVEQRMKLLACWNPKKYGSKAELEHTGNVQHNLEVKFV